MTWKSVQKGKQIAKRLLKKGVYVEWFNDWQKCGCGDKVVGMLRKTRVFCSSHCCGNPRRTKGQITRKERMAEMKLREGLEEFYEEVG